jgi:hypothetical protein
MQRIDDVTGAPIEDRVRLSSREREEQREWIVLTLQSLKLTWHPDSGELFTGADEALERRIAAAFKLIEQRTQDIGGAIGDGMAAHEALAATVADFHGRTFWHRLRWLVMGR